MSAELVVKIDEQHGLDGKWGAPSSFNILSTEVVKCTQYHFDLTS